MKELLIKVIFNSPEWDGYEDASDEILLIDSGILDGLTNGVGIEIVKERSEYETER